MTRLGLIALVIASASAGAAGCVRPGEDRALLDRDVGVAFIADLSLSVADGKACVRQLDGAQVQLWAQAPALTIEVTSAVARTFAIDVRNALADATLVGIDAAGTPLTIRDRGTGDVATRRIFDVDLPAGDSQLEFAPADQDDIAPWRFAFLADIQTGLDDVGDIFDRMNQDRALRFVLFGGDATEDGKRSELVRLQDELERLSIPLYATPGNHELHGDDQHWFELFGLRNLSFAYRGVRFTLIDSANATIDPLIYERMGPWLAAGRNQVHVFATHIPPFDPVGVRGGAFRSRREAAALYSDLVAAEVDLVLVGHIHSYYASLFAGIPTYVSGGGGAQPSEYLDGIGRHYLAIDVDPGQQLTTVGLVRVAR